MPDLLRVGHAVTLGRVDHQVKLLVILLKLIHKLDRILHMNVVVHNAVDQKKVPVKVSESLGAHCSAP